MQRGIHLREVNGTSSEESYLSCVSPGMSPCADMISRPPSCFVRWLLCLWGFTRGGGLSEDKVLSVNPADCCSHQDVQCQGTKWVGKQNWWQVLQCQEQRAINWQAKVNRKMIARASKRKAAHSSGLKPFWDAIEIQSALRVWFHCGHPMSDSSRHIQVGPA